MVANINVGNSLYGALAYNGQKVNEGEGRLLAVNRVFDDGSGRVDVARAERDFKRFMPEQVRTRNRVIHISLNPHPDDRLTDTELEQLAREYLDRLGYGDQPYLVFKHEDISRHHLHIVSVNVDESGRRLNRDFIHRRSKRITSELEKKYGLHPADRRQHRTDNPLRRVDTSQGDVKRQVSNVAKAVMATYKFRTMGEYRALLSLYNVTVEEAHGMVDGREYHGLVYFPLSPNNSSATDDAGNKTGNPFKASRIGKSVGYEAVQLRFEYSKGQIRDRHLAEITRKTVAAALARTYRREEFVALLKDFDGHFGQPDVDRRLVLSVHDGRALLVVDVGILVADLHEAVPKLVEFVVERCAADLLLCVVELDADVALLDDDGLREVLVVHEDAGDVGAIYFAAEGELTVYDVAGVEVGQVAVFRHLQIELLAVEVRHVGGALYVVGAGTGGERQECGNSIDDLVHNMFDHLAEAVSATDPFRFRY